MKELISSEDRELAITICELLDSKKAENIELFNVTHLSNLADYFVMATVSNNVQAKALADFIQESLGKVNVKLLRRDGVNDWIILDYNFVIVHIFTPEVKEFYHLDKLWNDGKNVYTLSSIKKMLDKEEKNEKQKVEKDERVEKYIAEREEKARNREARKILRTGNSQPKMDDVKNQVEEKLEKKTKPTKVTQSDKIKKDSKKETTSKKAQPKKDLKK